MKRILFYTENFSGKDAKGGTEKATLRISEALKSTGDIEVYAACRKKWDGIDKSVYTDVIRLRGSATKFRKELSDFIKKHRIDVVVNMTRFYRHKLICEAALKSGRDVNVIFMQHFAPGSERKKPTFAAGLHLLKLNPYNPLYWLRATLYPLLKLPRNLKLCNLYKSTYDLSDKVVLLSESYRDDYCSMGNFSDRSKFVAIPNIYEKVNSNSPGNLQEQGQEELIKKKSKKVLILSRLDEIQKRLSLALKIWAKIENDPDLYDWHLDIVGTGHNRDIVERLIKKLHLERVTLHGWQSPEPFLKDAEILMMTSEYEGLPLTLLEAQAYGVVPVAFNSFSSLKDVITPFETGVVVENHGDINEFTKKLTELMHSEDYREELRKNALAKTDKFSPEKIAEKWLKILT